MSRSTLATIKASRLWKTIGLCADSEDFVEIINEAQNRLINKGNFKGSYQRFRICTENACITLPRQIMTITDLALCNYATPIKNMWWEFIPNGEGLMQNEGCGCTGHKLIDRGFFPTYRDISGTNKQLRVYPSLSADVGKTVHIFGYDSNNQWIRSEYPASSGTYIDGFKMTLALPFVQSSFDVSSVTGFQKEVTKGNVLLYYVDTTTSEQIQMGVYEPDETIAEFRRYYFGQLDNCTGCNDTSTLMGIAKLDFIPVQNDWDYLFIDNIPALKMMAQSIRMSEMDSDSAQKQSLFLEARAIKELNDQKRSLNPYPSIRLNTQGSAPLQRRRVGGLI